MCDRTHGVFLAWLAVGMLWASGCRTAGDSVLPAATLLQRDSSRSEPPLKAEWVVTASGSQEECFSPAYACDGRRDTRWSSPAGDPQWLSMDLGREATLCGAAIQWDQAFAAGYEILLSADGETWTQAYAVRQGDGGSDEFFFAPQSARYVKILCQKRGTEWGFSIWEVDLKGSSEQPVILAPGKSHELSERLMDGRQDPAWQSMGVGPASILIDLRKQKTFSGLRLDWGDNYAVDMEMSASKDGESWKKAAGLEGGDGVFDVLSHPAIAAQYLRLDLLTPAEERPFSIREISLRGADEVMTPLMRYRMAAGKARPGLYPLLLRSHQVFWTLCGPPGDGGNSLLDEFGNFQPGATSGTLMPYLFTEGSLVSPLDAEGVTCSLEEDSLPLPSVMWVLPGLRLNIRAYAAGSPSGAFTFVEYRLFNTAESNRVGSLFLVLRPISFDSNGPTDGLVDIQAVDYEKTPEGSVLRINGAPSLVLLDAPSGFGVRAFDQGDAIRDVARGILPPSNALNQSGTLLSAAIEYPFDLAPGSNWSVVVAAPLHNRMDDASVYASGYGQASRAEAFEAGRNTMRQFWRERMGAPIIELPDTHVANSLRAQTGFLLVSRAGLALESGARLTGGVRIQTGATAAAALLRMGIAEPVREYLDWYAERIRPDGKVPPVLNGDGSVPKDASAAPEYASQGQFVFALIEYCRFTRDRAFLRKHFKTLQQVLAYLVQLRERTLDPSYMESAPARERFAGILPASAGQEGATAPMHRYADDFWALLAWSDAKEAAEALDEADLASWAELQRRQLLHAVKTSLEQTMAYARIAHIPGCAEKGELDPLATAAAFFPCAVGGELPQAAVQTTFDRYYAGLVSRLNTNWSGAFSPREACIIPALVALGRKDYAEVLLSFLLDYRRPTGWQQWPETVAGDPAASGYRSGAPDIQAGAAWIGAIRGLLVSEQSKRLVLLAGAPASWVQKGTGVSLRNAPTYFGLLDMTAVANRRSLTVELGGDAHPPDGFDLRWPLPGRPSRVLLDGVETTNGISDLSFLFPSSGRKIVAEWSQ